ncbi:hypothetical protein WJX81_006438 [Elliptochloris bilobata]|uniref:C2 domain-containing protein n=1 Tax=Elliptochloris bilobata TaxID=381761 RepID=A0AAW1QL89_9CHLO
MAERGEKVRGYLVISAREASGKNKEEKVVWEPNFVEGFVKVEIRGGPRNVKVQSAPKRVLANSLSWDERLTLEVLEGATELRLMLCREKRTGTRVGTSVIAACGIFVNDILDAVPIDKYFELFKPGAGGEGGYIRISINFVKDLKDLDKSAENGKPQPRAFQPQLSFQGYGADGSGQSPLDRAAAATDRGTQGKGGGKKKRGFPYFKLLVAAALAAAAAKVYQDKKAAEAPAEPQPVVLPFKGKRR